MVTTGYRPSIQDVVSEAESAVRAYEGETLRKLFELPKQGTEFIYQRSCCFVSMWGDGFPLIYGPQQQEEEDTHSLPTGVLVYGQCIIRKQCHLGHKQ
jgi:hypothetical protein